MPKTLAALPSSQYATLFDDVWGKLLALAASLAAASSTGAPTCEALIVALLRSGWVDFHLTDCDMDGRGAEDRDAASEE